MKIFRSAGVVAIAFSVFFSANSAQAFEPENPQCIAPASPGGGWDFICRTTAKNLFDLGLIKDAMQVTNMTGGGGGVAFAHVTNERKNDNSVIAAASMSTSARIAQGIYKGASFDSVYWIGTFGAEYGALAVKKDSKFKNLNDLVEALKADPRSVGFSGGSSVGSYDHIKPMLLARAAGIKDVKRLKYIAYSGGGEAMTGLLSNAVDVLSGDFSEMRGFVDSGDIRIIAILAPERVKSYPDIPTAKEQGYDVIGANWRGLYMPAGASDEAKAFWTNAIMKMTEDEAFQKDLEAKAIEPFNNFGDDMNNFVKGTIQDINELSKEIGIIK